MSVDPPWIRDDPRALRIRIEQLEVLIRILASGLLLKEYGKDLAGVEHICRELVHNGIEAAMRTVQEIENA
jgi:hypothetical protein